MVQELNGGNETVYAEKCQVILVVCVTNKGFMVVEQLTQIVMTVTGVYAVLKVLNLVQN